MKDYFFALAMVPFILEGFLPPLKAFKLFLHSKSLGNSWSQEKQWQIVASECSARSHCDTNFGTLVLARSS